VKAEGQGSFAEYVTLPEANAGEFAILATDSEGSAAVSILSVTAQCSAAETAPSATNATSAANATTAEGAADTTANAMIQMKLQLARFCQTPL
jgi:hypothetical protein